MPRLIGFEGKSTLSLYAPAALHPPHHPCPGFVVLCPQEELSAAGGEGTAGQDRDGGGVQTHNIPLSYNKV